jgi:hypothetical protein
MCIASGCFDSKPGKLAREAYLSLKKIETKVETGVNYRDYCKAVSDARCAVNIFMESDENKNMSIRQSISKIMEQYIFVTVIWSNRIKTNYFYISSSQDKALFNKIAKLYPKIVVEGDFINTEKAMLLLWADASLELNEISKFFK